MKKEKTLKICVGYHKPSFLLQGDCFVPVWGGKAVANETSKDGLGLSEEEKQWMETHCIGDDTGDNISVRNRHYCEASILYWMWKNYDQLGNPDYVGFLQYRRHWVLNNRYLENYKPDFYNMIYSDVFSSDYQYKIGCIQYELKKILENTDGIFCANDTGRSIEDYKTHHHSQDSKYWLKALDIIKKDWPQYAMAAEEYNKGTWHAWSNCFIMKREDFLEYCPFLFDVLKKVDDWAFREYESMTMEQMRIPAYLSETILGIWWMYKKSQGYHFETRPLMYVKKPFESLCSLQKHLSPLHKTAIPIVFIADENYVKYTSVAIKSIIQHASDNNLYDIIILHDGKIKNGTQQRITEMQTKNVFIRFFNASYYMMHYNFSEFFHRRLNLMPYLKLFIHEILKDYNKALFLDGDLLVLKDIAELYNEPLDGKLVGATTDVIMCYVKNSFWDNKRNYIFANDKIKNIYNYKNSGVLLLNLKEMRETPELTHKFINEARFLHPNRSHHDQDVFNFVLEDNIKLLQKKFNFQSCVFKSGNIENIPEKIKKEMFSLRQSDEIVVMHYDGDPKPWQSKNVNDCMSDLWWKYARTTSFYEDIIYKNTQPPVSSQIVSKEILNDIFNYTKNKHKYWRYKLLSKITFGKKRKHYKKKRKEVKAHLKNVRHFFKSK